MSVGRVKLRAGFVLLITVVVWLDQGFLLLVVFAAALLHELGHYIPLRMLGGRVACLELTGGGIGMESVMPVATGYGRELLTVLGGPAASAAFAVVFSSAAGMCAQNSQFACALGSEYVKLFSALAGMCLSHGVFNLLPMRGLDGGRALEIILCSAGCPCPDAVLNITTAVTACALAVLCGVLAWRYSNISLLFAMIYVLTSISPPKMRRK